MVKNAENKKFTKNAIDKQLSWVYTDIVNSEGAVDRKLSPRCLIFLVGTEVPSPR